MLSINEKSNDWEDLGDAAILGGQKNIDSYTDQKQYRAYDKFKDRYELKNKAIISRVGNIKQLLKGVDDASKQAENLVIEHIKNMDDYYYYGRKWIGKKFVNEDDDIDVYDLPYDNGVVA